MKIECIRLSRLGGQKIDIDFSASRIRCTKQACPLPFTIEALQKVVAVNDGADQPRPISCHLPDFTDSTRKANPVET